MINVASKIIWLKAWLVLLEGYFDDSGTESAPKNEYVCLAGYLSPTSNWDAFNARWEGLLLRHGIPEVHMTKWDATRRAKGWTEEHAKAVLLEFIDVMRTSQLWGFGAGLDSEQWLKIPKDKRKRFGGSAQEFLMQRIVRMIIEKTDESGLIAHINLVFDQDEAYSKPRLTRYYAVRRIDPRAKERASIISFANSTTCYSLQAADILVYLTRQRLMERAKGAPESELWTRLMTPPPGEVLMYEWDGWTGPELEAELDKAVSELLPT